MNLQRLVEETISEGVRIFGKGVFRLFDFIGDSLPQKEVQ
jgi:hypothetical protein